MSESRLVPSEGPNDAKIVIIGEAPGYDEDRLLRPFMGESGQLLNAALSSVGISRSQCYIMNVFQERPPRNNIKHFLDISKKAPIYNHDGEKLIEEFKDELRELNPNIIITLGNVPLWCLTGKKGILTWRGSLIHTDESLFGRKVKLIPLMHPSYILRNPVYASTNRLIFLRDLKRAAIHSKTPKLWEDPNTYDVRPSYAEINDFLLECSRDKRIAFDIEIGRGEVSCISFSRQGRPNYAMTIPFHGSEGLYCSKFQEASLWKFIGSILENKNIEKVIHNAAFDCVFLYKKYGIKTQNIHDTMIAQAILWPDIVAKKFPIKGKSLAFTSTFYTEMPYYKDEGKEIMLQKGRMNTSSEDTQFWTYCAKDSVVLLEILGKQLRDLRSLGNLHIYDRHRRLINPFMYMHERGMKVSLEAREESKQEMVKERDTLEEEFYTLTGGEVSPTSPKQLADYFYIEKKSPVIKSRKTGNITTDADSLKVLARRGFREASLIGEMRKIDKLIGTYYDMALREDGRLVSGFNPVGAETGRFSSGKDIFGIGGNMQNIPKSMRKFLIVDDGYIGFEIDLSQAENRLVALYSNEERMLYAFENKIDIHSQTASLLFGGEPTKEYQDSKISKYGNGTRTQRYWGKQSNHALNYEMGSGTASLIWEIPMKDAKAIIEKYHSVYPGIRRWHRKVQNTLKMNKKTVENLYGRRRRYTIMWGKELFHQAYAWINQSTVADHINEYGFLYLYERQDLFPEAEILNQIHDSIVFQIPLDVGWNRISEILAQIKQSMQRQVEWEGRKMSIPADATMNIHNFKDGIELPDVKASTLEAAYKGDLS